MANESQGGCVCSFAYDPDFLCAKSFFSSLGDAPVIFAAVRALLITY